MTLFSDLVFIRFCCNWWNFILCNGWIIILLKIYKHAFLLIKYPCSTRDLGPPRPSFCLWIVLRSVEAYQAHFLAQAFKTSLRGCHGPSWAVQVLCMGFIGFPHNLRDIALSLSLFFDSSPQVPVCKRLQQVVSLPLSHWESPWVPLAVTIFLNSVFEDFGSFEEYWSDIL